MTIKSVFLSVVAAALLSPLVTQAADTPKHNYPTMTRVEYVQACTKLFDRPFQELIYKCACAIDAIANEVEHDKWIALLTFNNAAPIAGERGSYLRERKDIRTHVKHYRELQGRARNACFLPDPKK